MEQDLQRTSDLLFDAENPHYDPLVELTIDEEDIDDSEGQLGPNTEYNAKAYYAIKPDGRSAAERIQDLFEALAPRRRVLLAILEYLDVPKRSDALDEKVNELQQNDISVYSGYNFSALLEEAGAIKKVDEDGEDCDEEAEQMPDIVEIDGVKFYKPTDGKQVFWLITDDGLAYLEADNPFGRLTELVADEQQYQRIYKSVLEFCNAEGGRTAAELSELIDDDPLVQKPRRYFSSFVKKLEDCNALMWGKKWQTTELGNKGLELLFVEATEAQINQKLMGGE